MEPIGRRIKTIRSELKRTQNEVSRDAGLDQPRLSKIEKGELLPSVAVVDALAAVFGRTGRDLVVGTDREAYYFAETMTTEQIGEERANARLNEFCKILMLVQFYQRIFDLFEALYGGDVAPRVGGAEFVYTQLRTNCEKLLTEIESFAPGASARAYFPDHLEIQDDMDGTIDEWHVGERGSVKESQRAFEGLLVPYLRDVEDLQPWKEWIAEHFKLDAIDQQITKVRSERERIERRWMAPHAPESNH